MKDSTNSSTRKYMREFEPCELFTPKHMLKVERSEIFLLMKLVGDVLLSGMKGNAEP